MLMELQGKKKTRDFLSLYTKDSSCQLQDSRSHPPQGFLMKTTHDFLQPLETAENEKARRGPTQRTTHVLPGGIGTYSISHVSSGASTFAAVKPESNTCGPDAAYAFPVWDAAKTAGPTTGKFASFHRLIIHAWDKCTAVIWLESCYCSLSVTRYRLRCARGPRDGRVRSRDTLKWGPRKSIGMVERRVNLRVLFGGFNRGAHAGVSQEIWQ